MYGLLISFGIFLSLLYCSKKTTKEDILWGAAFWAIIFGVLGARLYHIIDYSSYYLAHPWETINLPHGGLGIYGGIFGALAGITLYLRKKKENLIYWLDLFALGAPLAQAIGRFGNFFNQELYGKPTTLPWAIYIDKSQRLPGLENVQTYHPLFLYEALALMGLFFLLSKLPKKPGTTFATYLAGYAFIRFFLEFLRLRTWTIYGLNVAQGVSIMILTIALIYLFRINKK